MGAQSSCASQCGEDVTQAPSSDGASGGLLSSQTQLKTGAQDRERQRRPWRGAEPAKTFTARLSEFSCGNRDECPSYFLWFYLLREPPLCKSSSFPFFGLPIPGLIGGQQQGCGRVWKAATVAYSCHICPARPTGIP